MKNILRFIAYLQYNFIAILLFGACIAIAFRLAHLPDITLLASKDLMISLTLIPLFIYGFSIEVFYTNEKLDEYLLKDAGRITHTTLVFDYHFYPTMIDDIGIKRKIAGYAYAISKIMFCTVLGAKLCFVFTGPFFK